MPRETQIQKGMRQHLESSGVSSVSISRFMRHILPENKDPRAQVIGINRRLRTDLGNCRGDTITARSCLQDSMDFDEWLHCFGRYIVPALLRHGLL